MWSNSKVLRVQRFQTIEVIFTHRISEVGNAIASIRFHSIFGTDLLFFYM